MAMLAIGGLLLLAATVCQIIILVHAFKESLAQGFLSLCVPFYILYYMFAKFEHDKKAMIIGIALGGAIVGNILMQVGVASMAGAM
ncbi:MAG: hypothetical protein OXT09_17055 [Myxococcales bacterium]|nr:hypothetical protein [Myxococcales bacterium]